MNIASLLSEDAEPTNNGPSSTTQPQSQSHLGKRSRPGPANRTTSLLSNEVLMSPSPEAPDANVVNGIASRIEVNGTTANAGSAQSSGDPSSTYSSQYRPSLANQHHSSFTSQGDSHGGNLSPSHRPDLNATRSPSISHARHLAPPNIRTHSASDLVMAEAPVQTPPPRNFTAPSVSDTDLQTINELTSYLADHSYDYTSHVQLINLLHRGFVAHVNAPPDESMIPPQPSDYTLLKDLRMARGAMDSRYSVGEDIWRDWINDESMLAHSSEERQAVMELCQKAVQEEPASVVLWSLYGEWVWQTYAVANGLLEGDEDTWTEEDKMICKEIFTRDMVLLIWGQAVEAIKWRIDESSVVWDRYLEIIMHDSTEHPSKSFIEEVQALYMTRLQIPQASTESTSQSFWSFVSKHKSGSWEEIMTATNEAAGPAKKEFALREPHELEVTRAFRGGDNVALYNSYVSYLEWEVKQGHRKKKAGPFNQELRCALYERALLRFPTMIEWWLDYVDYVISLDGNSKSILRVLERATRHCPWSGDLWARRLLRVELETNDYAEVESVKHKATNSGLLPIGGIEEILIVYSAWCSYLRRRACNPTASDDDVDMAEFAISGVLTDIGIDGKKAYGEGFNGDPRWRIEKIFIQFLTQARRINEARELWVKLIPAQGDSYDFWQQYYDWEIFVWGAERTILNLRDQTADNSPQRASAVLREAMSQRNLDWPEKIHELYAYHFETYEVAEVIQQAQLDLRTSKKYLKIRREKEAAAAAAEAPATLQSEAQDGTEPTANAKRKREEEPATNGESLVKRTKMEGTAAMIEGHTESSSSAAAQIKRDREHNTITVKSLPEEVSEKAVRNFFSDCGNILSVGIVADPNRGSASATIEFETHEDVLAAKTRDGKPFEGREIRIQQGTLSTLYVTNYPPSWAEDEIQDLFSSYGTIVGIRFPSLKYSKNRRFCYVQFLTADEARKATELHNKIIDSQHHLKVLISDPEAKQQRHGATAEGREIHVRNIEHAATEQELRAFFEQAGKIEQVRMIRAANGRFTGTAFLVYATPREAEEALSLNNKAMQERLLGVSIATDKTTRDAANRKAGATKIFETARSASPSQPNGVEGGAGSPMDEGERAEHDTARTKNQRTVALLELPDTVNDTRVHDFFSQFGPIRKLTIRRDKDGAMIEFVNLEDAGKVGLGADASSLGPNCRVGRVEELFGQRRKKDSKAGQQSSEGGKTSGAAKLMRPAQVGRPGQKAGRGGRKIGLGFQGRKGGEAGEDASGAAKKGNSDFRAMFLGSGGGEKDGGQGKGAEDS